MMDVRFAWPVSFRAVWRRARIRNSPGRAGELRETVYVLAKNFNGECAGLSV